MQRTIKAGAWLKNRKAATANMKANLVAHCQGGGHDKVYMSCIRKAGNQFQVVGKWGRRGAVLAEQLKLTTGSEYAAQSEQQNLFRAKLNKGYVDITSSSYSGPLNMAHPHVKPYLEQEKSPPLVMEPTCPECGKEVTISGRPCLDCECKKSEAAAKRKAEREAKEMPEEMVCKDNAGMEDRFDKGISYLVAGKSNDPKMILMFDKLGEQRECYRDRFIKP